MKTASQISPHLDNPIVLYNVLSERVFFFFDAITFTTAFSLLYKRQVQEMGLTSDR